MKLMIGTVQFGLDYGIANQDGKPSEEESCDIMRLALENKIHWVDTARTYGSSEKVLGDIARKLDTKLDIVTKTLTHGKPEEIVSILRQSLDDLGVESVRGLLVHHANALMDENRDIVFGYMQEAKDLGLIEKIGVTVYTPAQAFEILDNYAIDIMQVPCNILDQRFVSSGAIKHLARHNVEVHVRSIFLQGLLLMDLDVVPDYFKPIMKYLTRLHVLTEINNVSMLKASIDYAKSLESVDRIIVGVQNVSQLSDVIKAYNDPQNYNIGPEQFAIGNEKFIDPSRWDY